MFLCKATALSTNILLLYVDFTAVDGCAVLCSKFTHVLLYSSHHGTTNALLACFSAIIYALCSLYSVCSAAHNCMYVCCAWLKKGRGGVREGVGGQSRAEHFGRKCSFLFLASTLTKKLPHLFCPKCIFLLKHSKNVRLLCTFGSWRHD